MCAQGFNFLHVGGRCQAERWEDPSSLFALTTAEQKQQKSRRPHLPVSGAAPYGDAVQVIVRETKPWHRCPVWMNWAGIQIFTFICRLLSSVCASRLPGLTGFCPNTAKGCFWAGASALSILRGRQRRAEKAGGTQEVSD